MPHPKWLLFWILVLTPSLALAADPTLTEYELRTTTTTVTGTGDKPETEVADHRFKLKVFTVPDDPMRVVVTVTGDLEDSQNLPLGILRAVDDEWIVDLEDSRGRLLSRALLPVLKPEVPKQRLRSLSRGKDAVSPPGLLVDDMPVEYTTAKQGEGEDDAAARVVYTLEYKGESPFISTRGTIMTRLRDFMHQYTFDGDRVVAVDWFHSLEQSIGTKPPRTLTQDLEITETSRRVLSEKEVKQVLAELKILEPVARALRPGMDHTLRESKTGRKLEKSFEGYVKKYKEGLLADAVPDIQRHFGKVIAKLELPDDPEDRARLMRGKPAPDFTLTDVNGTEITLSTLRGKAVVINFWALL